VETYHVENGCDIHGYNGPVHASHGGIGISPLYREFVSSAKLQGINEVHDLQDFKCAHGVATWPKWINPDTGRRSDAAHCYLRPTLQTQKNLSLLLECIVTRVTFEGNRATGVEYLAK
jgi:alcohol oxidase